MEGSATTGWFNVLANSDGIGKSAALLLLAMSVVTWYFIFFKGWQAWRARRQADTALQEFWNAKNLTDALASMRASAPDSAFTLAADEGAGALAHHQRHVGARLAESLDLSEFLTRAIRRAIGRATARLEAGLSILASIGATAPFVGLFGTVWGIYHALVGMGVSGQTTIDQVAGPVGEALIMTAFGIAVAVPAVLAYNGLTRANRVLLAELDAFAHDLHAYLATGARVDARDSLPAPATARRA